MRRALVVLFAITVAAAMPAAAQQSAADSAWRAGDRARAEQLYGELLRADSSNTTALHRTAILRSWRGEYAASLALLDRLLRLEPQNVEARTTRARVLGWSGRHAEAEREFERLLAEHPQDADIRAGLEQVRAASARSLNGVLVYENDSDENDVVTLALTGAAPVARGFRVRLDLYGRHAATPQRSERAFGATAGARYEWRSGWSASAGLGGAVRDGAGFDPLALYHVAVGTPNARDLALTVSYAQSALDYTAAQIARELFTRELAGEVRARLRAWSAAAAAAAADYQSRDFEGSNSRVDLQATLSRRIADVWTLGLRARTFGFDRDLDDGYFDPERFVVGELTARYQRESPRWHALLEAAPGLQRITRHDDTEESTESFRANTRLAYRFSPGSELGLTAAWARSGEQQLADSGDAAYRYVAFGIIGSVRF